MADPMPPTPDATSPPSSAPDFAGAMAAIDAANAEDPNRIEFGGQTHPKEVLHAERASHWLGRLEPEASELLRLAVRAHHLRRWELPRSSHPQGRAGYHRWRRALQDRHAEQAARILADHGYGPEQAARVGELIRKRGLGRDPEAQTFEDVLCLVFVETQLEDFAAEHAPDKVVDILARTLPKMSERARTIAAELCASSAASALLARAVERLETA